MKFPKSIRTYCPHCKKNTNHKVSLVKGGGKRGTLKKGSIQRAMKRGRGIGYGNKGRWGSKPSKPKRSGAKGSKKMNLKLTCEVCDKGIIRHGRRVKRVEVK
ncbi:MAG: 50S ribosomal protein L44e [Nanoarchaeota archaeon]